MINRLSHVEIAVTDLARSRAFYCDVLGFVAHADSPESLWLRAPDEFDVWSLKLTLDEEAGLLGFGFRVAGEGRLDDLAALHAERGLPHQWLQSGSEPGRGRTLRVRTPGEHVVDFYHEVDEVLVRGDGGVRLPARHSHLRRGVGPTRLDHVNVRAVDFEGTLDYWRGALAFSASEIKIDENGRPQIAWLRRAPFSHDIALGTDERPGFHHFAYCVRDANALLAAADVLADAASGVIEYGPGRHGVTDALCLYLRDPDGNRIELYVGDYLRDLDRPPVVWRHDEYERLGLLWWGSLPPASFLAAGPVLERDLVGRLSAEGEHV